MLTTLTTFRGATTSMLQYLLLDDLYELLDELDEFDEPTDPEAISAIIDALFEFGPDPSDNPLAREEGTLYAHLREFQEELQQERSSRISAEYMRDAVLVWINRFQKKQRAAVLSAHDA